MDTYTLLSIRQVTQATLTLVLFTFPRSSSRTTNWWDLSLRLFFSRISPTCFLPCTQKLTGHNGTETFLNSYSQLFGSKGKCSGPKNVIACFVYISAYFFSHNELMRFEFFYPNFPCLLLAMHPKTHKTQWCRNLSELVFRFTIMTDLFWFERQMQCSGGPKKFHHSISNLRFILEITVLGWSRNSKTIVSLVLHQVQPLIFNWSYRFEWELIYSLQCQTGHAQSQALKTPRIPSEIHWPL